ncbi:hypothetical protein GCM10010913_14470 [Paenibacillus aceti]|uniref:Uncharacterized protein n=1 Tax=Paenibacillus aceti TaxID=1820010 RepID=A0ABQ1VS43_9BACL|nr:hypothetical protein GCM10010913_14470 [Paenibacillus aceti]
MSRLLSQSKTIIFEEWAGSKNMMNNLVKVKSKLYFADETIGGIVESNI